MVSCCPLVLCPCFSFKILSLTLDVVGQICSFPLQVQDCSNSNQNNCFESSYNSSPSPSSKFSFKECSSSNEGNQKFLTVISNVDHCSDDSDSEIFRIKRRSTLKAERKHAVVEKSKSAEDQVSLRILSSQ